MPSCQRCASSRPSGMADPAIAPMTAAPAPVRKAWIRVSAAQTVEVGRPGDDEAERGREGDESGQESSAEPSSGVAHNSDGLDDRSGCDLAEGHGIEELGSGHPVIGHDSVVLHERDDDEAASVGQRTDFEGDPAQGGDAAGEDRRGAGRHEEESGLAREVGETAPNGDLDEAASKEDERPGRAQWWLQTQPRRRSR